MIRLVRRLSTCLFLLTAVELSAIEEKSDPAATAMEQVVRASLEAQRSMNWRRSAELIHPKSLEDYRRMWLPTLKKATAKDVAQQVLVLFDQAADVPSLTALEPPAFYVSSMKGLQPQFWAMKPKQFDVQEKIIGFVREDTGHAFAVVRIRMKSNGSEVEKMELIGLKRDGKEWKVLLPEVVRSLADTLARSSTYEAPVETRKAIDEAQPEKQR